MQRMSRMMKYRVKGSRRGRLIASHLKKQLLLPSSRKRVMNHTWSSTKQRLHPQSVAEISHHSVMSWGQDSTMWDIIWVSPKDTDQCL